MYTAAIVADGFNYGHMTGGGWWGWGMMLLWVGVIAVAGYALAKSAQSQQRQSQTSEPAPPDPLEVLAARYARGEIDSAEYRTRRETLRG